MDFWKVCSNEPEQQHVAEAVSTSEYFFYQRRMIWLTFGALAMVQAFLCGEAASSGSALRLLLFRVLSGRAGGIQLAPTQKPAYEHVMCKPAPLYIRSTGRHAGISSMLECPRVDKAALPSTIHPDFLIGDLQGQVLPPEGV